MPLPSMRAEPSAPDMAPLAPDAGRAAPPAFCVMRMPLSSMVMSKPPRTPLAEEPDFSMRMTDGCGGAGIAGSWGTACGRGALGGLGGRGSLAATCSRVSVMRQLKGGSCCTMAASAMSKIDKSPKRRQLMPTNQFA